MNYKIIAKDGRAKRAEVSTVHGTIQTPVFMNVGTVGAIKGAVSTDDLKEIRTQVELSNTYHLHVRTGDKLIREFGGLHKFMNWDRPILTDSGGFQVFSLTGLRKIKEEGVYFQSHIDGHRIFMGPEESMQIQSNLGSTIAMALDECPPHPATREYMQNSVDRTTRWLERCKVEMARLNSLPETINQEQLLFGINQGGTYEDIRIEHAKTISAMDLDGYALGGLAVGESHEEMYRILDETVPYLPEHKPTYLMGVGTPANILEAAILTRLLSLSCLRRTPTEPPNRAKPYSNTLPRLKSCHKGKKPQKPPRQTTPCSAWLTGKPSEPRARAWAMTAGRQSTT